MSPHGHTNVSPHALRPWSILAQLKVKEAKKRTDKKELMSNKRKKEKKLRMNAYIQTTSPSFSSRLCHNTVPILLPAYVTILCPSCFLPMSQYCAHPASCLCHNTVPIRLPVYVTILCPSGFLPMSQYTVLTKLPPMSHLCAQIKRLFL